MNSRERVQALLRHEIPDQMGLFEHFWPETITKYWSVQGYPKDADPQVYFNFDLRFCNLGINSEPLIGPPVIVEQNERWRVVRDGRGATLKYWQEKSGTPEHIGFDCTSPERWREVYRPRLLDFDRARLPDIAEAKKSLETAREDGRFAIAGNLFVFELMRATIGDQNFLPALLMDPDWIRDFCQVYLDLYRTHYEVLFREAGLPDGLLIYEDFGFSNGLFCSPDIMRELVIPYEKQLVGFFKDYGLPVILHTCGDIRKAMPLIIEAGFDCLQPMEAKAGCDVVEFAETYGDRLAYMGNINVVELLTNDPVRVRREIEHKVREMGRRRIPYFFHSDHSIPPEVTMETYRLALDIFHENARY